MIQTNFNHWLLYSVLGELYCRNPKGVVADNQGLFLTQITRPLWISSMLHSFWEPGWRNTPYLCAFVAEEKEKWQDALMGLKLFLGIPSLSYTNFTLIFFCLFFLISWRLITLQYCSGFCHTLKWISHGFTCIPHPDPPSHLPLHLIPLGLPFTLILLAKAWC